MLDRIQSWKAVQDKPTVSVAFGLSFFASLEVIYTLNKAAYNDLASYRSIYISICCSLILMLQFNSYAAVQFACRELLYSFCNTILLACILASCIGVEISNGLCFESMTSLDRSHSGFQSLVFLNVYSKDV
jgi:hypothetical protein